MARTIAPTDLASHIADHQALADTLARELLPTIDAIAARVAASRASGGRLLVCGNGGSAADAQHFAAELLRRARRERRPLPAVAPSTDASAVTAIKDYAFEDIFARQVLAHARAGDAVVGISTSSGSEPHLRAHRRLGGGVSLETLSRVATRRLSLIGNAHIDPVWLWRWTEGMQERRVRRRS